MCARRFLIIIFIFILLAVLGAFALFQFGDRVLIQQAVPVGRYQEPAPRSGPDYASDTAWIAKPGLADDPSAWVPEGEISTRGAKRAATFFVHPTTYLERDRWNAPLNLDGEADSRTRLFVRSQASAFNSVSDIWAPRYRQAAFGTFLLRSEDADKALGLAYRDVLAAFDAFIAAQPPGKPLFLAAHSQGSLHLSRLLVDRKEAIAGRLVAAYVVGWPLSTRADLQPAGVAACGTAQATGCVLSWQTFSEPANPRLVLDAWKGTKGPTGIIREQADMLCTNPLTGSTGAGAAPMANKGTLVPNGGLASASLVAGQVGARCDKGFLLIEGEIPDLGPYLLPGNNYHVYDYALFWGSIRADAEKRLAQWR
ncbi:DUF3089 domain-containing protein [Sphingomonas xanthus]|uniref:DUF3089 domain-containing protein n=1 Tax=Sphingomonas xanthus TaxID=2594473 RepID=A0A516IP30_9SPHN|nr:DUF3089 domain-containing protein [Sphingomonas xanthus]QDP18675.1 DUF3089 domain-containing protein [Sphingomonas xanthus]